VDRERSYCSISIHNKYFPPVQKQYPPPLLRSSVYNHKAPPVQNWCSLPFLSESCIRTPPVAPGSMGPSTSRVIYSRLGPETKQVDPIIMDYVVNVLKVRGIPTHERPTPLA